MLSTVYHKKASVLNIPPRPPFPKGDHKEYRYIFMRFLHTRLGEDPLLLFILLAGSQHVSPDRLEERGARGIAQLVRNPDHMRLL